MVCWLAQHGSATSKLDASITQSACMAIEQDILGSSSWMRYKHGFNVLPMLLPNLQHLNFACGEGFMFAEDDLFSLQKLVHISTLTLRIASNGNWKLDTLDPLQRLTALECLQLIVDDMNPEPMLLAPSLSCLTMRTSLTLGKCSRYRGPQSDAYECKYDTQNAGDIISNFVLLQCLDLQCVVAAIPDSFSSLHNLQCMSIAGQHDVWPDFKVSKSFSHCCQLTSLRLEGFDAHIGQLADAEATGAGCPPGGAGRVAGQPLLLRRPRHRACPDGHLCLPMLLQQVHPACTLLCKAPLMSATFPS